jgi:post-segregation antitoxin (ccd killing protein)
VVICAYRSGGLKDLNINVYVPDDLGERVKGEELEVSSICQKALGRVLEDRELARARGGKMKRIEVEVGSSKSGLHTKAFTGRWLVEPQEVSSYITFESKGQLLREGRSWGLALSQKGKFVVFKGNERESIESPLGGSLFVLDSLGEAEERLGVPREIIEKAFAQVGPLRTDRVEELDI